MVDALTMEIGEIEKEIGAFEQDCETCQEMLKKLTRELEVFAETVAQAKVCFIYFSILYLKY